MASDARRARRRAQRAGTHKPEVIVMGEGNLAARELDQRYKPSYFRELPEKVLGEHRWVCIASYVVNQDQAAAALDPTAEQILDHENIMALQIGCWDCELVLGDHVEPGMTTARSGCESQGDD